MKKTTIEIRQAFLDFFYKKGHKIVQASSLLPDNDSTLLLTNSGMNQFKNIFLGLCKPMYRRVVTAQPCIRAGGKHNDLENVGYTGYHLTFFEMLGNFSFGDYFKKDAIQFAWELLTSSEWFNLPKEKLLITVHADDQESYDIWSNIIGVSHKCIVRIGSNMTINNKNYLSDNFWQMADIGPCGPCSEIFYDYGDNVVKVNQGSINIKDYSRYIEVWNLVFMQFDRQLDGSLLPLPTLSVDTGMGLERIASILQSVNDNYSIDLFYSLMVDITQIIEKVVDFKNKSLRVITDHIRSCCFLIIDGIKPSNEGRGYVLRRLIRRAVRHGKNLGIYETFFYKLVHAVVKNMGYLNGQLIVYQKTIEDILLHEERQFFSVIARGLEVLKKKLSKLDNKNILSGETVFYLYSTYGLPLQVIEDFCCNQKCHIDRLGFERKMLLHQEDARRVTKFIPDWNKFLLGKQYTNFVGYETCSCHAKIVFLFRDNQVVDVISKGNSGVIVLNQTPFYGESGGQVGDCGELKIGSFIFMVETTKKYGHVFCHIGKVLHGVFCLGDQVIANIDQEYRKKVSLNHSSTHLLHFALCSIFGNHILQKGSFIGDQFLRFDFSHTASVSFDEICSLENIVNKQIQNNVLIQSDIVSIDVALNKKVKMLLGKKYDRMVRMLSIGDFSVELCSGTHAIYTGDIGLFVICHESSIASGVRRIEAVSGMQALSNLHQERVLIKSIESCVQGNKNNLLQKISMLNTRIDLLQEELNKFKNRIICEQAEYFIQKVRYIQNIKLIVGQVINFDLRMLRIIASNLKNQLGSFGVVIISTLSCNNTMNIIVSITDDLISYINAVEIIDYIISEIGGKGGGRLNLAQAFGGNIQKFLRIMDTLDEILIKKYKKI